MAETTGSISTLSDWAGDYVTNMLGQAQALGPAVYDDAGNLVSGRPFQQYGTEQAKYYGDLAKNLVAGPTTTQQQIFSGIGNLTVPSAITNAASTLQNLSGANVSFTPTTFTNTYQALPDYQASNIANPYQALADYQAKQFASTYAAPQKYTASQIQSFFTTPEAYKAATLTPTEFNMQNLQQYMNPYLESVLEPQRKEAQRQAEIARNQMQGRMAQAGAYGGSRQAIMESEAQRNLQDKLNEITGQGYFQAYESGAKRFDEAFNRELNSAKFQEESRQFGAQYALDSAKARAAAELEAAKVNELSRQFGYGKEMDAASEAAKYAMEADRLSELSRQFGYGEKGKTASEAAKYALEAARQNELSRQFGYGQKAEAASEAAKYGLEAAKASDLSRKYGADVGLNLLGQQISAAQAAAQAGALEGRYGLDALKTQMDVAEAERKIEQDRLAAAYQQFLREEQDPYKQLEFQKNMIAGIPGISSVLYPQQGQDAFEALLGGAKNAAGLIDLLKKLVPEG